ncbi:MAG: biopolymer transporter ExbD [Opitutales bacterium]
MFDNTLDDESDAVVDLAPLIDCVFLLLIFFLVATTMKEQTKTLELDLPTGVTMAESSAVEDAVMVIGIDRQGQIYLGATPAGTDTLIQEVKARAAANPNTRVRVDFDKLTPGQSIVQVVDLVKFAGLTQIGIHIGEENQ